MAKKRNMKSDPVSSDLWRNRIVGHADVPPGDLIAHDLNWRSHPEAQRGAFRGSVNELGFIRSVTVNKRNGRIIDGHLRVEEALTSNQPTVSVEYVDLDEAEEMLALATVDAIAAMALADKGRLDALLREVSTGSAAVQQMLTDLAEKAGVIPGMGSAPEPGNGGDEFDTKAALEGECRVKPGEIWLIDGGRHRILCGDSTKAEDVGHLMGGEKAVLMNTDPPYGVKLDLKANHDASNAAKGIDKQYRQFEEIANDDLTGEKLQAFLESCIRAAVPHLVDNAAFYLWHPMLTQGTFFAAAAAAAADILIHRQIIFVKPHFIFGRGDYHWKHELCFYGWQKGNRPPFYGERNQDTVWVLDEGGGSIRKDQHHPTQKPIELFVRPIKNHCKPNEVVYEPFAGSGSQIIAAHRCGVQCRAIELSPVYVEVCLRRCEAESLSVEKAG